MTLSNNDRRSIELHIVRRLVRDILAAGYVISVNDGEAFTVKRSDNRSQIIKAMFTTDCDMLVVRLPGTDRPPVGSVTLIYGNSGHDVMSDWTDNDVMTELTAGARALSDWYENPGRQRGGVFIVC